MKSEKKPDDDNQYQLIDLDELEFQPIKIRYRGKEYIIKSYTCDDAARIDEIEQEAMTQSGRVKALMEVMARITGIPLKELLKMEFSTYQQMRSRLFLGISLGKKKEPKKSD